jgi:glutathione S-transferase
VRIYLAEKGIQVPYEQVDLAKGEHQTPEFLAKNPLGNVPVLELDDGTCLNESVAICRYFEELHPEPPLFGTDPVDRALVEMWQRRMEFNLFLSVALCFRNTSEFFKGRIPQVPEYGELSRKAADKAFAWLDGELADREFVAGDRYTIADITALCGVDFGRFAQIKVSEDQKNLKRWYDAVASRPSAGA